MHNKEKIDNYLLKTYGQYDIEVEKGEGCYITDAKGNVYLDMAAGIATNSLGYNHPKLTKALQDQVSKVMHISNYYYSAPQARTAELLVEATPFDRVFFCNSGTEANEAAIKLARKYGKQKHEDKYTIISMKQSFHGRTYGALSATGQEKYQAPFIPVVAGFNWVTFNDQEELKQVMNENVCAVMIEVIQGEGGVRMIDEDYLKLIRSLCDQYDALMIIDEVQTGIGRCGSLFAYSEYEVEPDVVTSAKGLGGGVPVGAMLCKEKVAVLEKGDHGTTFGGNPLATTAASVVLEEVLGDLQDHINEVGTYLEQQLEVRLQRYPVIKEVRGKKLMQGIELQVSAGPIIAQCMENGLLVVGAGETIIRLLPPLVISKEEIDKGLAILDTVLESYI